MPEKEPRPEQPRAKRLIRFWPFNRRKTQPINQEARQFKREIDEEAEEIRPAVQRKKIRKILEQGPENIDEILEVVNELDYKDFRYLELAKKYGEGTLGKLKAFLAGESDFGIDQNDEIRRNGWNACAEAGRKVLYTVFNRRTIAATGAAAVLGILTGGVGAAAGGVIFGSMVSRGVAEAFSAITGKERGARRDVLIRERGRWYELKELAGKLQEEKDVQERTNLMIQITDLYFKQGENRVLQLLRVANEKFESEKQGLNKFRNRLQTIGEIVGLGVGIAHSYLAGRFASIDIDLWHKVKGQSLMHEVVKINDTWHFVYNSAQEAVSAHQSGAAMSGFAHVLGEPAWKIGVATFAERGLPVLLSAFGAAVYGGRYERQTTEKEAEYQAKIEKIQREMVLESLSKSSEPKGPKRTEEVAPEVPLPNPGDLYYLTIPSDKEGGSSYVGRIEVVEIDKKAKKVKIKLLDEFTEEGPTGRSMEVNAALLASATKGPYSEKQREQGFSEEGPDLNKMPGSYKLILKKLEEWDGKSPLYVDFPEDADLPGPLKRLLEERPRHQIKICNKPDFRRNEITIRDEEGKKYTIRLTLFARWVKDLSETPLPALEAAEPEHEED